MASVSFNPQSFAIDGRRTWIVGASIDYTRIVPEQWPYVLAAARQAGFNTVQTPVPWMIHEPRRGRYDFEGQANVRGFIDRCGEAGLKVILRAGPFIGAGYDGGGLPPWLGEIDGIAVREANEAYLERAGRYLRKLVGEVGDAQASSGGPLLLVQAEHAWTCSHREQAERYLREIIRVLRESGINVPIVTANDLWVELPEAIETWRGGEEMLSHVRQLRTVQPEAPRLVSTLPAAHLLAWGDPEETISPERVQRSFAEVLAAGGQAVICPFAGGTNFGFLAGQLPGRQGAGVITTAGLGAPLDEVGTRGPAYLAMKRLAQFADHFGHVFADLDPDYQPVTVDPGELEQQRSGRGSGRGFSVVPLRGAQGRVVFIFGHGSTRQGMLLLDHGVRMPIDLGDQSVGWYVLEVDVQGKGRLDYANLCPLAMAGRGTIVLQGAEGATALLSVGGAALHQTVPGGRKPLVLQHKGITFVICNQPQADHTYHDGTTVYVGVAGLDLEGKPIPAPGWAQATVIAGDGEVTTRRMSGERGRGGRGRAPATELTWTGAPARDQIDGTSPRYATLDGPQTLAASGAGQGYGWYRITLKTGSARKRLVHLPGAADRLHVFLGGERQHLFGTGPGADPSAFELRLPRGESTLVALVDNLGRFGGGNDLLQRRGLFDHIYEVKPLRTGKPKMIGGGPIDPFVLRGFIKGLAYGQVSETRQIAWTFTHARKAPILVDVNDAAASGTFVLNDTPIAYYAGATGGRLMRLMLHPAEMEAFRRGRNELRFAPDPHQEDGAADVAAHTVLYECTEAVTAGATWAFAKWEAPQESQFSEVGRTESRNLRGTPCWWRATVQLERDAGPWWLDTAGLSKGQAFLNGHNLGRYFTARADGRAVGPQKRLHLPQAWLASSGPNELLIFDEHGCDPGKARVEG